MLRRFHELICVTFLLSFLSFSGPVQAVTILYDATNLADTTSGEDLWRYDYYVSDYTFPADYGFDVFFDVSLYSNLENVTPLNSDWDVLVFQPDPSIPDDGWFDALALTDGASLNDPFSVKFVWLGTSTPGIQAFEVYDTSFSPIESGHTAPAHSPVPEPGTFSLLAIGLFALAKLRKRGSNSLT